MSRNLYQSAKLFSGIIVGKNSDVTFCVCLVIMQEKREVELKNSIVDPEKRKSLKSVETAEKNKLPSNEGESNCI